MTRVRDMSHVACGTRQDNVVVQMYSSHSGQEICIAAFSANTAGTTDQPMYQ